MKELLRITPDIGQIGGFHIEPHWAYHLGGALCIVLLIVCIYFTYRAHKKKTIYESEYEKLHWLKTFWRKNRFLFFVLMDVILLILSIVFFAVGAGAFQ